MRTFVTSEMRNGMMNVDGYSSAKSAKAALADFGRYIVRRFSEAEGRYLMEFTEEDVDSLDSLENVSGEWYCEVEEVSCASRYNEETDEVEEKEGYNFYVYVRFVAN